MSWTGDSCDSSGPNATPERDVGGPHTVHREWNGSSPLLLTVATAVARATDTEVTALPALYDAVDPEALEQLVRSVSDETRPAVEVAFRFADCDVHVSGTGEVTVHSASSTED